MGPVEADPPAWVGSVQARGGEVAGGLALALRVAIDQQADVQDPERHAQRLQVAGRERAPGGVGTGLR